MLAFFRRRAAAPSFVILLLCAATLPSCYTTGLRFPNQVRRVAVPVFDNQTFVRGVELDMTDRIRALLLERSDVELVKNESQADASIRGRILRVDFPVLVGGNKQRVLEGSTVIQVAAELVDVKSGRVLARVRGDDRAEFTTTLSENRSTATAELVDELAWRVLLGLSARSEEEAPLPAQ